MNRIMNKALPASVFMEIVTHFRKSLETINSIIRFIIENNMQIYNNMKGCSITNHTLNLLLDDDYQELVVKQLLCRKIDYEVEFAASFLLIIVSVYIESHIQQLEKFHDKQTLNSIRNYFHQILEDDGKEMTKESIATFRGVLNEAYANNNAEKSLKKAYIQILEEKCSVYKAIIDAAAEANTQDVDLYKVLTDSINKSKKAFRCGKIMYNVSRKISNDREFMSYAKEQIVSIFKRRDMTQCQAEYIGLMFDSWIADKQQLRKNDIMDMYCVGVLDANLSEHATNILEDTTPYLITFDNAMRRITKMYSKMSETVIETFLRKS